MSKMNWGRVQRENQVAQYSDYSARLDEAERRLDGSAPRRKKKKRRKKASTPQNKGPERRPEVQKIARKTRARGSTGTSQLEVLKDEARSKGIPVHEVLERRLVRSSGWQNPPPHDPGAASGRRKRPLQPAKAAGAPYSPPLPAKASKAEKKRRRAEVEARSRGLTVEQLLAERRRVAAANQALHEEAERMGTTVKALRRTRSNGGPAI